MQGKLTVLRIHDAKKIENEKGLKVFGVRIAKFLPEEWEHWDGLTPSKQLLFKTKEYEKNDQWDEKKFREFYLPNYLKEIKKNEKAKLELKKIINEIKNGKNVYYACYCADYRKCHRRIVGEIIRKKGYEVEFK